MLHKMDNLIMADCILRLLRLDKKLKHVDGIIKPYMDNNEQGFTLKLSKLSLGDILSFSVNENGEITVYIYKAALEFLDKSFQIRKVYSGDSFMSAKNYIADAIVTLIKNEKQLFNPMTKYNAL